jgi:hypothetical protein
MKDISNPRGGNSFDRAVSVARASTAVRLKAARAHDLSKD